MRYCYLDTSALVKLYALEPDSKIVEDLVRSARLETPTVRIVVLGLALPEAAAAIASKERSGHLTHAQADRALARLFEDFEGEVRPFVVMDPGSLIMGDAGRIAREHALKGYDSVQLAGAIAAHHSTPAGVRFTLFTADEDLARAARTENLDVVDLQPWEPQPKLRRPPASP